MNFLNLSLGELAGLAGVISAGVLALYLLDRSKRRQIVATLRFWTAGAPQTDWKHKRRIQQPWSLVLQLLSIILLLLAVAGPRWGGLTGSARDHVLILDTSAWMGARARQGILLDQAKTAALAYLNALPSGDRVMLVRADALATPVTPFESDYKIVANAINQSQPGASALNLEQALDFSQHAQRLQADKPGEIVFAGAGRVPKQDAELIAALPNLRVLAIPSNGENVGLRKLGVRRVAASPDSWEAFVLLRNDGSRPRDVNLELQFGGTPVGTKGLTLAGGAESQATFTFRAAAAGYLEARIRSANGRGDAFPQDDRAVIELPAQRRLRVLIYSNEPELLKALTGGSPQLDAVFERPAKYDPQAKADVVVFDRFAPAVPPSASSIWIEPPPGSPFSVRATKTKIKLERWRSETPIAAGLYTRDAELASTQIFAPSTGDQTVAETADGAVIIQRNGPPKMVALGFHPVRSSLKYELATPLLMANILRWMAPETFRRVDMQAGTVGTVSVPLDPGTNPANVRVLGDNQRPLPLTIEGNVLRFFAGAPGNVRLITGDRETVYSLTLPDVADAAWKPAANVRRGIPRSLAGTVSAVNLWPWLAVAGGLGLLLDWLLFGRSRILYMGARRATGGIAQRILWKKAS
jgi:hypothetical protein